MQFLCECMKTDCEIDCDSRGRHLRSCQPKSLRVGNAVIEKRSRVKEHLVMMNRVLSVHFDFPLFLNILYPTDKTGKG